jgi:hypothetical protein
LKTFQLRRYELKRDNAREFVAWVKNEIFPRRVSLGFTIEWSYFDQENSELVWLAAANCDKAEFESLSAAWEASEARGEAVRTMPDSLIKINASFVEVA